MKKAIFMTIITSILLTACTPQEEPKNKSVTTVESTPKKSNDEIYGTILEKYKQALMNEENPHADSSINTVAISNYFIYGRNMIGKDYINYGYYDIDKNGKDELLLFTEYDKNSRNTTMPFSVYTYDENNNVINLTPEGVNGERTIMQISSDKHIIVRGSGGAWTHGYTFYKLADNGKNTIKLAGFLFDAFEGKSQTYKKTFPVNESEELSREEFENKYLQNIMEFDTNVRKNILS